MSLHAVQGILRYLHASVFESIGDDYSDSPGILVKYGHVSRNERYSAINLYNPLFWHPKTFLKTYLS